MRAHVACALGLAVALLVLALPARADRVALLPSRGDADPAAKTALDVDLTRAALALRHTVIPETEVAAAVKAAVADGVADTPEEYRVLGAATKADWVVVATTEPAVVTAHVEIAACLVPLGRVESVARDVEKAQSLTQLQEMLAVLLRPEGIGVGELPWERPPAVRAPAPSPPRPAQPPPPPSPDAGKSIIHLDYLAGTERVWPAYSAGRRGMVGVSQGFSFAVARPGDATGNTGAIVALARAGYAPGDRGIELFGELGGNLWGPRALWVQAGGRWMLTPSLHRQPDGALNAGPFHVGPELTLGAFVRLPGPDVVGAGGVTYSSSADVHAVIGAALDMALSVSPSFQLETQLGNLRFVPTGDGPIVLVGATLGATLRL